ncbi:BON domain-containing protein [Calothrix sp. 336/3]|uniref:BON domain-containing protein n=1 Tax=Calothrix sp. 336/3 TaxID=1337936 RepID=UPI0004E2C750|nr:BON domain-containing protein [Calothrix sp. 336/3]AKG21125.1 transporter [Calothrix sp. 336/3]
MKSIFPFLVSGVLVFAAAGCETPSRTSTEAPSNVNEEAKSPAKEAAQTTQNDATSDTRKRQIESDIRAREQRNNTTGGDTDRDDADLESEVRGKLEANLPASNLTVDSEQGAVTIAGNVPTQEQLNRIPSLAQEIKGVKSVKVDVKVAPATKPSQNN